MSGVVFLIGVTAAVACTCAQSNGTTAMSTGSFDNYPRLSPAAYRHRPRFTPSTRSRLGGRRGFFEAAYVPPAPRPLQAPVLGAPVAAPLVIGREPRRNPRFASRGSLS